MLPMEIFIILWQRICFADTKYNTVPVADAVIFNDYTETLAWKSGAEMGGWIRHV